MTYATDVSIERLSATLREACRAAGAPPDFEPQLARPRDPEHGDWSSNAALVLAARLDVAPRELAERVREAFDPAAADVSEVEVAGPGFLNFRLAEASIWPRVAEILAADETWGRTPAASPRRVNVEFVSANPTGPLHVAHGRGAALGDAVASLIDWTGDEVTREFYVNDAGRQIRLLAESVDARLRELDGETAAIPEGGYQGSYLIDVARRVREAIGGEELARLAQAERLERIEAESIRLLRDEQAGDLEQFGVSMDLFFSERTLYESGAVTRLLERLAADGLAYEAEGAVWLRTSDFGDEKDRVLVKGDGSYTYFLPDLAYHLDKAARGFELTIDVWGADHQGHEKRMLAALAALGHAGLLEVLILQLVTVMRGGEEARMSKRAGRFVTLRDLVDETGPDVARYFFLMRRPEVHLNFDLDLALDTSEANPVYKVQYAHARMCSVFARAGLDPASLEVDAEGLEALETEAEREVALALLRLPEVVRVAARARAPHQLCAYLEETAGLVNGWYHEGNLDRDLRILAEGPARRGRLKLARAVQITLRNGLRILGLGAPQAMAREEG